MNTIGNNINGINKYTDISQKENNKPTATPKDEQNQQSTVTISDQALNIKKVEESIEKIPVVNDDKVAAIRKQIEDGTYKVDSNKIADKMIQMELDLFGL